MAQWFKARKAKALGGCFLTAVGVGIAQAVELRKQYLKRGVLPPPTGSDSGILHKSMITDLEELAELRKMQIKKWADALKKEKDELLMLLDQVKNEKERERILLEWKSRTFSDFHREESADETSAIDNSIEKIEKIRDWVTKFNQFALESRGGDEYLLEKEGSLKSDVKGDVSVVRSSSNLKILILGDSLVAGVGQDTNDLDSSPVLPTELSRILLNDPSMQSVEWRSSAVIGGTITSIRQQTLPKLVKSGFLKDADQENDFLVVLVICGLNDWKSYFFSFGQSMPNSGGPSFFRSELQILTEQLRDKHGARKIFLPSLPMEFLASDKNFIFRPFPFSWIVWAVNSMWEIQKFNVAAEFVKRGYDCVWFIPEPAIPDETEEKNLVSSDGIHMSSTGYKIWAAYLAKQILDIVKSKE